MPDEYGDIGKRVGSQWATEGSVLNQKDLHVKGSLRKGGGIYSFHMFNPPTVKGEGCRVRCGMCKCGMDGFKSCPNCFPERQEADGNHNVGQIQRVRS